MLKLNFFLFFIFLTTVVFAQNPIEFNFLSQGASDVKKNGRLELGLTLPEEEMDAISMFLNSRPHQRRGLNPFVSWDVDIKAKFTHLESGEEQSAIGFWYTEMERNEALDKWNELATDLPFRIRLAPDKIGLWEVSVEVRIKGSLAYQSDTKQFHVVDSEYKGFVTLNPQTQYLERDGQTIIPTGVNLPYPYNYNNLTYSLKKEETLALKAWEEYSGMVQDYIDEGGKFFRFFMHPSCSDIEFEEVGYYQDHQNHAWEMDRLIEMCEETNTLIQFNMLFHQIFMKLGDYNQFRFDYSDYWHDKTVWPYKDLNDISGYSRILKSRTPSDMFLNPLGMKYLKQRARYIMARWGYSTSLSIVELASEPWHIDQNSYENEAPYSDPTPAGDTARKAVYEYHKQIANYIKDSLNYRQHLLGVVGTIPMRPGRIFSHPVEEGLKFADSSWYVDNIDIISISFYSDYPNKLIISKKNNNNECEEDETSMACAIQRLKDTYQKPVIFGESDHGDDTEACSNYQGHKIDIMRYPYTGAIGHHIWAIFGYKEDKDGNVLKNDRAYWPPIIEAQNYFNAKDFIKIIDHEGVFGRETATYSGLDNYPVETQYILNDTHTEAVGYVYNRTYNISTAAGESPENIAETPCQLKLTAFSTPTTIKWRPRPLKVEGLDFYRRYKITFYNYTDYTAISSSIYHSNFGGKLKIKHPDLVPSQNGTPLLWYRVELIK